MKSKISPLYVLFITLFSLLLAPIAFAGSATWRSDAATSDWNTPANWTPNTVPNGSADVATFAVSNTTSVVVDTAEVDSIVFNPGASAFTITCTSDVYNGILSITGAGVINNSGVTQNFISTAAVPIGLVDFQGSSSAGSEVIYTNKGKGTSLGGQVNFLDSSTAATATFINEGGGGDLDHQQPGVVAFFDTASADHATFVCKGAIKGGFGGTVAFWSSSTAGNGTFTCAGGADRRASGAAIQFSDSATAGNAIFTFNGTGFDGSGGSFVNFLSSSTAGNATLIANKGPVAGGSISFSNSSTGGTARIAVFGNGGMGIADLHSGPGVTIGSLEGDGLVSLDTYILTIGSNNLSTTFAGVIQDAGSVTKIGRGKLTLSGANTYSGVTTVSQGTLLIRNSTGSGTGTGPVQVNAGSLGGTGIITGAVTLGTGAGAGATLSPGSRVSLGTLTTQSTLAFQSDGIYDFALNSGRVLSDKVIAKGVAIAVGASITLVDNGATTLPSGTVFTVISNTAATPISGAFSNLGDKSTVTIGSNTYQANYEGGDGNDLTLTVLP